MKAKAQEVISGLSAPQKKRLITFCRNLSTDKDPQLFDDKMLKLLEEVSKDPKWIDDEMKYLRTLGYNQSKYVYKTLEKQIYNFADEHREYYGWNENFDKAKKSFIDEVKSWKLRALDFERNDDIQDWIPRDDAHAGWSYIITGLRNKGDYRGNLHSEYLEKVAKAKREGSFNTIILPGTRTQTSPPYEQHDGARKGKYEEKTRLVSMIDIFLVLAETTFAGPVQNKMSAVDWYAGGKNDPQLYSVLNRYQRRHTNSWITLDYSKFDQSIPGWLIYHAFDVVEEMFDKSFGFDEHLWRIVKDDLVHKVFITGDMKLVEAHDGVPSGSMFTQILDSVVNRLMIDTYFNSRGIDSSDYSMIIMGDDNLIYADFEINRDDIEGYIFTMFGVVINADKSTYGMINEPPEFLSRYWTNKGVYRQPAILLSKLVFPENFRKYSKDDRQRAYEMSMIISCFIHDFPLGMQWVSKNRFDIVSMREMSAQDSTKFTTGLMRYRMMTLKQKEVWQTTAG